MNMRFAAPCTAFAMLGATLPTPSFAKGSEKWEPTILVYSDSLAFLPVIHNCLERLEDRSTKTRMFKVVNLNLVAQSQTDESTLSQIVRNWETSDAALKELTPTARKVRDSALKSVSTSTAYLRVRTLPIPGGVELQAMFFPSIERSKSLEIKRLWSQKFSYRSIFIKDDTEDVPLKIERFLVGFFEGANLAPIAKINFRRMDADTAFVFVNSEVVLDGTKSIDPDGDLAKLEFTWDQVHTETSIPLEFSGKQREIVLRPSNVGYYSITLKVSDGAAVSVPDTLVIAAVEPPILTRTGDSSETSLDLNLHNYVLGTLEEEVLDSTSLAAEFAEPVFRIDKVSESMAQSYRFFFKTRQDTLTNGPSGDGMANGDYINYGFPPFTLPELFAKTRKQYSATFTVSSRYGTSDPITVHSTRTTTPPLYSNLTIRGLLEFNLKPKTSPDLFPSVDLGYHITRNSFITLGSSFPGTVTIDGEVPRYDFFYFTVGSKFLAGTVLLRRRFDKSPVADVDLERLMLGLSISEIPPYRSFMRDLWQMKPGRMVCEVGWSPESRWTWGSTYRIPIPNEAFLLLFPLSQMVLTDKNQGIVPFWEVGK